MTTVNEMKNLIGCRVRWRPNPELNFIVEVEVIDVRQRFGTIDCLIKPVAGTGEAWVNRFKLMPQ